VPEVELPKGPCIQFIDENGSVIATEKNKIHLSFQATIGRIESREILVRNPSHVTLHFTWSESRPVHRDFRPSAMDMPPRVFVSQAHGVLLPHESKIIRFSFMSAMPGVFLEIWTLTIDPCMPNVDNEKDHDDDDTDSSRQEEILYASEYSVHVTGVAVDHQAPYQARKAMTATIEKEARYFMIERLLRSIIDTIEYPVIIDTCPETASKQDIFERQNNRHTVYYSSEVCHA
jgi:hypothetical protein